MTTPDTRLCAYVATLEERAYSTQTLERVSQALLDWFTAGWSGAAMAPASTLRDLAQKVFPGDGSVPVFGASAATTAIGTAFANAGIAHLREIDDAHRTAMLHPGIVAISPALALAHSRPISTQRFISAVVAGYEVSLRVGEALGSEHSGRFHSTATAGSLGAAAASAVVLGLDSTQLQHALGIAATQAAGLWQFVDDEAHESKALHPAFAVRNGITAAYAAQAGYPGARAFMSGKRGMHALLHANGPLDALDRGLGDDDRINSTTIKAWPTCAQLFTSIGAAAALFEEHRPEPGQIESVDIAIFPQALRIAGIEWPTKAAETCFSARYCVAVLLLTGKLGIKEMETPDFELPGLTKLARQICVRAEPSYAAAFPERRPCTVTVTMTDGRVFSAMRDLRRGDPEDPFDWKQLENRLRVFAPTLTEAKARIVVDWCLRISSADATTRFQLPSPALFCPD